MGTKYSSNAASGYNATPPADDGTVSEANKVKWATVKTKLADPVKDLADTINSELATHFNNGPNAYTTNQTLGATHYNTINQVSGAGVTLTLTDAATLTAGWYCDIVNTDSTNTVSLARATASDMINETSADVTIQTLSHLRVIVNAAANGFMVTNAPRLTKAFKTAEDYTHSGLVTMSAKSMYWAKGADIASASPLVIGSDGNYFDVTGTTGFAAMTVPAGLTFMLQFDGILTLTHHATNLNLPGGANITTAAGDRMICFATAANTVHVLDYSFADAREFVPSPKGSIATTSGTSVTLASSIPSWVKAISIGFTSISTNGTSTPIVQLGDAGGLEATGYTGAIVSDGSQGQLSTGFLIMTAANVAAAGSISGGILLIKGTSNRWFCTGGTGRDDATIASFVAGYKDLSDTLTQIAITMTNGTDAFDSGAAEVVFLG